MAETRSPRRTHIESDLTQSEMVAVHQLMQLSDEENSKVRSRSSYEDEEEVDQSQTLSDITSAKIQEILGKDEFFRPKKKRRYRSLESLYMDTRPIIKAANSKKVRACIKNSRWVYSTNRSG
ncbi:hypothetical protein L6164_025052 [Bauhinia variegata]|uniref:Uncharacterized protein n=1 Tax=Bauhinia variegata TaxID=167791 RepID=A0ACB9M0D3_BAUVA|nr:hypothetical protein L6164_025052 [Bauhinia variegata]